MRLGRLERLLAMVVFSVSCVAARAQIEPAIMLHSAPAANDNLGVSIDVDRDTMIVGAYNYDPAGKLNAGAAIVFRWAGTAWVEEARLVAADGFASDQFGRSVSISGNTAVVGAVGADLPGKNNAGAIYVFQRSGTTWTQVTKLTASDSAAGDQLGVSVDFDGDTILSGAPTKTGTAGSAQGAAYVFTRTAGVWSQQAKLLDSIGASGDQFGASVALQGDTCVVASPFDDVTLTDRGSASVFTRSSGLWTKRTTLNPGDGLAFDNFGNCVAIDNGTIVVGASSHDLTTNGNQGAIYVFTGSGATWLQQSKLTRPSPAGNDFFPTSIAIQGDTVVAGFQSFDGIVGANQGAGVYFSRAGTIWTSGQFFQPNETQAGALIGSSVTISDQFVGIGSFSYSKTATGQGAAFAFRRVSGGEPSRALTIAPPTPEADANFGNRMASDGTRLVVGVPNENAGGQTDAGAVYIYRVQDESIILEQRITPNDPFAGKKFGSSLAIDGTSVIVGAVEDTGTGTGVGSAYVFTFNGSTWSQQAKLVASDGTASDRFGYSVAISGDRAVVGAPYEDIVISSVNQGDAGAAYFFTRSGTTWTQTSKAFYSAASFQDFFGWSVAIDGDVAFLGAPNYDTTASINQNRGAVFFYKWNGTSWAYDALKSFTGTIDSEQLGSVLSMRTGLLGVSSPGDDFVGFWEWTGTNVVFRGSVSSVDSSFGNALSVQADTVVVGMPGYGGNGGMVTRYTRSGSSITSAASHFPGTVDASDNLGEAVGYAGGMIFAGGGGIAIGSANNCGGVRRLQFGPRYDPFPLNTSNSVRYSSLASMLSSVPSQENDLVSELGPLARSGGFSFGATRATLNVPVAPFMASVHTVTLTDGSELSTSNSDMRLWNRTSVPAGALATIRAGTLLLDLPSSLDISAGASLVVTPTVATFAGSTTMLPGSLLNANFLENRGSLANFGGVVSTSSLNNTAGATVSGYGDYAIAVTNAGLFDVDADTQIAGNFSNLAGGTITVFNGTLTILGTLTNNGTIIGDVQGIRSPNSAAADPLGLYAAPVFGPRAVQSIYAKGGISMDASARLSPSTGSIIKTAGNFDCAIASNLNFDMVGRTLQLTARGPQTLEAMSMDRGSSLDNLNPSLPGSFPIGTLRIGPAQADVTIVDTRDNDGLGQTVCEAVYVDTLIIDAGTTLNVPCGKVYYKTLVSNGTILSPLNVVPLRGPCPADFNQDGFLTFEDFDAFVAAFEAGQAAADFNADGFLTFEDFDAFVAAFEAGC
ncbi:MAG: GC-type dockerin domain-anchored protein [Planctomycetota bacterium]|nr:GC-type dockerin domain-anchored protein [Planctomycetota bacterium]